MGRSKGKRSNTRNSYSRAFKKHGQEHSSTYIRNFKLGENVDISANSSIQRGLPYKFYHGKTGKIFSITKFSAGVKVEKKVGNKRVLKRLNIRMEHFKEILFDRGQQHLVSFNKIIYVDPEPYSIIV